MYRRNFLGALLAGAAALTAWPTAKAAPAPQAELPPDCLARIEQALVEMEGERVVFSFRRGPNGALVMRPVHI